MEELAEETRKGAPALDPKREALLLTAARQRIDFRATQGILTPEDELFPLREGELLPRLLSKPWTEETRAAAKGRAASETSSDSEYEKRRPNTQLDTWCRQHEAENPALKISEPREEALERRIRLARVAYYRELEDGERVALSGSVMGPQMEPPAGQGPSSSATEHPQALRARVQVNHPQPTETQGQLVHLHKMEEDEADRGPPLPVEMTEAAVTSAAPSGQPRTPVLGDRRQAAGVRMVPLLGKPQAWSRRKARVLRA